MSESDKIKIVKRGKNTFDIYGIPGTSSYENLKEAAKELSKYIDKLQKENKELIALAETIKKLPVEFKDDRLLLLVDKTIINNGNYESNFINKDKIVKIKKQLENGEVRAYPGTDGTEFAIGIIDKLLEE